MIYLISLRLSTVLGVGTLEYFEFEGEGVGVIGEDVDVGVFLFELFEILLFGFEFGLEGEDVLAVVVNGFDSLIFFHYNNSNDKIYTIKNPPVYEINN